MEQFAAITAHSAENAQDAPAESSAENISGAPRSGESVLAQYAQDLTAKARNGEIDPVAGRDEEIRQIIDILMRRRQNNLLLTGEAGVGKTAVVEGLALRIVAGDVPPQLRDVKLCLLDIGMLQAGAGVKGEFEKRLQAVIDEVQSSPTPIILFIDEIHTLIGAGGAQGTGDAANLLKPALARGQLRTLGATTWSEYKEIHREGSGAHPPFPGGAGTRAERRQGAADAAQHRQPLEQHHRVLLLDEAVDAAVRLSHRYIPARQLPDKAVALLDTACARVAVSQHAEPAQVEDCRHRIDALQIELDIARRETKVGIGDPLRPQEIEAQLTALHQELEQLTDRWQQELALIQEIITLRAQLHRQEEESTEEETQAGPDADAARPVGRTAAAAERAAGRSAADLRRCRRQHRGGGSGRLDRHPAGPHGEKRD